MESKDPTNVYVVFGASGYVIWDHNIVDYFEALSLYKAQARLTREMDLSVLRMLRRLLTGGSSLLSIATRPT